MLPSSLSHVKITPSTKCIRADKLLRAQPRMSHAQAQAVSRETGSGRVKKEFIVIVPAFQQSPTEFIIAHVLFVFSFHIFG